MRLRLILGVMAISSAIGAAMAQTASNAPPAEIGNRANGFDYQPRPGQVAPREQAAGVAPSAQQQRKTNEDLFRLDAQSLKSEGLSTNGVPGHDSGR